MALVGNLRDLKLPNLIQINCMEKNKAKVLIEYRNKYGALYFSDGQIVHAEFNEKIGEEAVYALLSIKEGVFKVENDVHAPAETIRNSWSNVLLEGMRKIDETTDEIEIIAEHTIDELITARGISDAVIFSSSGEVLARSAEFDDQLIPFFNYAIFKTKSIQNIFNQGKSLGLVINLNRKYYFCPLGSHYLVIMLEDKSQIDLVLPQINPIISQKSKVF